MEGTKMGETAIAQKLVHSEGSKSGAPLPVSQEFLHQQRAEIGELTPKQLTSAYTDGIYRTPVPMEKVIAFGSQNISPAHQGGIQWAVDFYVPEGTPVRALASGKIDKIVQQFTEHGAETKYWEMGNGIRIWCENGECIWMEHMRHDFANELGLKIGQEVNAGDIVGISGNTGFTENPHVHTEVLEFKGDLKSAESVADYRNYITKKIRFDTRDIPFDLYKKEKEA